MGLSGRNIVSVVVAVVDSCRLPARPFVHRLEPDLGFAVRPATRRLRLPDQQGEHRRHATPAFRSRRVLRSSGCKVGFSSSSRPSRESMAGLNEPPPSFSRRQAFFPKIKAPGPPAPPPPPGRTHTT